MEIVFEVLLVNLKKNENFINLKKISGLKIMSRCVKEIHIASRNTSIVRDICMSSNYQNLNKFNLLEIGYNLR